MTFDPKIVIYAADGETEDTVYFPSGIIPNGQWLESSFTLRAQKGCAGGTLSLPGNVRNPIKIAARQVVQFFYDDSTPIYTGIADGSVRTIDGSRHEYTLRAPWADLESLDLSERKILGVNGSEAGIDTIAEIVTWIINNRIIGGTAYPLTLGTVTANAQSIAEFRMEPNQNLTQIFDQLALMAEGASGGRWCYGIAPDYSVYFLQIADADPAEYEIGGAGELVVWSGDENLRGRYVGNALTIRGGIAEAADASIRRMRRAYPHGGSPAAWTDSQTTWGKRRTRIAAMPSLVKEADFDLAADGWVNRYGQPTIKVDSITKLHNAAVPAFPWETKALYTDTQRGTLGGPEIISALEIQFGLGLTSQATIGLDAQDGYAPSEAADRLEEEIIYNDPGIIDEPEATDLLEPYADAPGSEPAPWGGGESGGELIGIELINMMVTAGAKPEDLVEALAKISNGGTTITARGGSVSFLFKQYDETVTLVSANSQPAEIIGTADNGFEIWHTVEPFTLLDYEGICYVAVKVAIDAVTYWYPCNMDEPLEVTKAAPIRVTSGGSGGEGGNITMVLGAHYVDGA